MHLRPYPYQIIIQFEDVRSHGLHCTLLRRFKLNRGLTIDALRADLKLLLNEFGIQAVELDTIASWSVSREHYLVKLSPELQLLKQQVDKRIKHKVTLRDESYDNLENLHVSFDDEHKQQLLASGHKLWHVVGIGIQSDFEDADSSFTY